MQDFYWFSFFVAVNALLLLLLTVNVSRLRMKNGISLGDGDNKALKASIRVHSNGTEQVPIYGLIVLALTLTGASTVVLCSLVLVFTLSRFVHAYGMLNKAFIFRRMGAAMTYASQAIAVIALLLCLVR
ncbi:MAG: MAPEG family protein [Spongiibacteraceae bacterium]|nr:MAPEG family protein [Spongiibacteraceae bacterium]